MKQFILFLVMVLNTGMLYSQTGKESKSDILEGKQVGDTLTGKGVKYKLYRDSENDLFVLQNLANQDSTGLREVYPDDKIDEYYIPREVSVKLATIVGSCLTPEQRAIYKRAYAREMFIHFRLEQGKIKELAFLFDKPEWRDVDPRFKDSEDNLRMLWTMSVDQFYKIERALIEEIDWRKEKWAREGTYLNVLITAGYIDGECREINYGH